MSKYAVKTVGLAKVFYSGFFRKRIVALNSLDLAVTEGEILGFLGPNGAGKTTTFKLLLGLINPSGGKVSFFGRNMREGEYRHLIGYLPENPYFYPYLTAEESLVFHGQLHGIPYAEIIRRSSKLLKMVGLSHARSRRLADFSRGMLQRIGIAQALINNPSLLILDEPMSGLDPFGRKEMRDIILSCREEGKTVIFSSHILSDVEMMCDRAAVILKGTLRDIVNVRDLLGRKTAHWEIVCDSGIWPKISEKFGNDLDVTHSGAQVIIRSGHENLAVALLEFISRNKGRLISYQPVRESLEDIFVRYAEKRNHE